MASINLSVLTYCSPDGIGSINLVANTDLSELIIFRIDGAETGYVEEIGKLINEHTFPDVPNDTYTCSARNADNSVSHTIGAIIVNCAESTGGGGGEEPDNTLIVTATHTDPTGYNLENGTATLNVTTPNLPFHSKLFKNNIELFGFIQLKTSYINLGHGNYTVTVIDNAGQTRSIDFVLTNPDPSEPQPAQYYAVGGVLPNPVNYYMSFSPSISGQKKKKHYVEIEIYLNEGLIATAQYRLNTEGTALCDISAYLKQPLNIDNNLSWHYIDHAQVNKFHIRYREKYAGGSSVWTVQNQPRYIIPAALQNYESSMYPYVCREGVQAKFLTSFEYPIKFKCFGTWVSTIIDKSLLGSPVYFERSYYASNGNLVERRSSLIPEEYYGKLIRLQITDDAIICANYVDIVLTSEQRLMEPVCNAETPPPVGYRVFSFPFDKSFV